MRLDKSTFQSIAAMFTHRRSGIDEIEALVMDASTTLTRDTVMRVIRHYTAALPARSRSVSDVLDMQVDAAGGVGGGVLRISVAGRAAIERTLEDAVWRPASTVAIRKARVRPSVTLQEYRLRVNMKEEVPVPPAQLASLLATVPTMMGKTFRLKRRFSFVLPGKAFRVDITAVRQKTVGAAVPKYDDMLRCAETYELEVEHIGVGEGAPKDSATPVGGDKLARDLVQNFNVLLKVVDDSNILLGRSEKLAVLQQYVTLVWGADAATHVPTDPRQRARLFVGPKPVTFCVSHLRDPEQVRQANGGDGVLVRDGDYTITDKADGEHRLLFVDKSGAAFTIDDRLSVRATGLRTPVAGIALSLLDGEHVASFNAYMAFDAYYVGGVDVRSQPLMAGPAEPKAAAKARAQTQAQSTRLAGAATVTRALSSTATGSSTGGSGAGTSSQQQYRALVKDFLYVDKGDDVFKKSRTLLLKRDAGKFPYEIDGIIFTPASFAVGASVSGAPPRSWATKPASWDHALKWKPAAFNSIDMLVRLKPDQDGLIATSSGQVYRVADVFVAQQAGPFTTRITPLDWATGAAESRFAAAAQAGPKAYEEVLFDAPGRPACVAGSSGKSLQGSTASSQKKPEPLHVVHLRRDAKDGKLRCENGDEILSDTIVEFAFDAGPPCAPDSPRPLARRWRPLRVRHDKTEPYLLTGVITANNVAVAQNVWSSIVNPVTEEMLSGRAPLPLPSDERGQPGQPGQQQDGQYYARREDEEGQDAAADARPMRRFNNWVKQDVLLMPFGDGRTRSLFDFGVGRGGDLDKWVRMGGVTRVLGIDKFGTNLTDPGIKGGGAFMRVIRAKQQQHRGAGAASSFPRIMFIEMDASLPITRSTIEALDDAAGDRTVARVLWGLVEPAGVPDARLRSYHGFALGGYDLAACMFAIHYFFDSRDHLATFAKNVAGVLRDGGVFVGCCLDGARVEALFRAGKVPVDGSVSGGCAAGAAQHQRCAWRITRRCAYAADADADAADADADEGTKGAKDAAGFGRRIDVYIDSIGQTLPEYLVDFPLLVRVMGEAGLRPLPASECKALGILGGEATGTFDDAFAALQRRIAGAGTMAGGHGGPNGVPKGLMQAVQSMTEDEKRYSFLNRWFVFQKAGGRTGSPAAV